MSANGDPNQSDLKIAGFIFLAACAIFGCGWWASWRGYEHSPPPAPLYSDQWILTNAEWTILPYLSIFILLLLFAAGIRKGSTPKYLNSIAFVMLVGGAFFWTEHTGGLSRGLYGAGYLSLVSVAAIVPTTQRGRFWAVTPVVLGAILLANAPSTDLHRERFYCFCCLLGLFLAAVIRWCLREQE
jgi:hypothetical protein